MKRFVRVALCALACVAYAHASEVTLAKSQHFEVVAEPGTPERLAPERVLSEFERIHRHFAACFGWSSPSPVRIHLVPSSAWPAPNATAFQNDDGVFFRAEEMATEQGNWLHEMTHMFYVGHFPRWFDEPSVRALTALRWDPALYPHPSGKPSPLTSRAWAQGSAFNATSGSVRSLEAVLDGLILRKPDLFCRFFALCRGRAVTGGLDFSPGRPMTRDEVLSLLSEAASEDVRPAFARWTGFAALPN